MKPDLLGTTPRFVFKLAALLHGPCAVRQAVLGPVLPVTHRASAAPCWGGRTQRSGVTCPRSPTRKWPVCPMACALDPCGFGIYISLLGSLQ